MITAMVSERTNYFLHFDLLNVLYAPRQLDQSCWVDWLRGQVTLQRLPNTCIGSIEMVTHDI